MPRYRLLIEYDGAPFVGWQRQTNGRAVQQAIEEAVTAFCGEATTVNGAGRTDSGVHALGQVAHIHLVREWPADTVRDAINAHLKPEPVSILKVESVGNDFDARFSAIKRYYRYVIVNRRAPLALEAGRAWQVMKALDADAMHEAGQVLVGHHDFTTFRSTECQSASPVKTVDRIDVRREGERIVVEVSARSFLHNQVRSFVGSLKQVGEGKWTSADLRAALEAKDRKACGPVAPPDGLFLVQVDYPG